MARKPLGQKVYKSMQGNIVDMDLLRKKNELTPAVGNARVNARGDELGPGGKIIKKREDVVGEYYKNTKPVANENVARTEPQEETAKTSTTKKKTTRAQKKAQEEVVPTNEEKQMFDEFDDDWVEDEDGNFIQKGEK